MIRSTFKQFFKLLRQNRFFTFLNLFGISITIMIIMMMDIQLENKIWPVGSENDKDQMVFYKDIVLEGEEWMAAGGFTLNLIENYIKKIDIPFTLAFCSSNPSTYFGENRTIDYTSRHTNADFWKVFDFNFIKGRPYNKEEVAKKVKSVVVSDRLEEFYFHGENALNKSIEIGGEPFQVVGVVEYVSMLNENSYSDIWIPYSFEEPESAELGQTGKYSITMRLNNMGDLPKLKAEMLLIGKKYSSQLDDGKLTIRGPYDAVEDFFMTNNIGGEETSKSTEILNLILKYLFILIIPAINLISINISRIEERASEIGVRIAFGATKKSIITKSIIENVILTIIGAIIGFLLAILGTELFKEKIFVEEYFGEAVNVNYMIYYSSFIICLAAALVLSVLSGLIPALKTANQQPATVLKGGKI